MASVDTGGKLYQIGCSKCGEMVRENESYPFLIQIEEGVFCVPEQYNLDTSGLMCGCDEEDDPGVHWTVTELEFSIKPQLAPLSEVQSAGIDPQSGVSVRPIGKDKDVVKLGRDCRVDYSVILDLLEGFACNIRHDLKALAYETQDPEYAGEYEEEFVIVHADCLDERIEEMWTAIMHSREDLIERAMWVSAAEIGEARKGIRKFW